MSVERLALMLSTRQGQTSNLETDISSGLQTVNPESKLTIIVLTVFLYAQHWHALQGGFLLTSCSPNPGTDGDRKQREHRRLKTIIDQLTNNRTRGHGQPQRGESRHHSRTVLSSIRYRANAFTSVVLPNTMEYNTENSVLFQKLGVFRKFRKAVLHFGLFTSYGATRIKWSFRLQFCVV